VFALGFWGFWPASYWLWYQTARFRAVVLGIDRETHPYLSCLLEGLLEAAVPEEAFRLLVLLLVCVFPWLIRGPSDGIAFGAIHGAGQAVSEIWNELPADAVAIIVHNPFGEGFAIARKLLVLSALGAVMGYYVGMWREKRAKGVRLLATAFFVPMVLHGLYDWGGHAGELAEPYFQAEEEPPWQVIVLYPGVYLVVFVVTLALAVWVMRKARRQAAVNNLAVLTK
jgi:protease PrsW